MLDLERPGVQLLSTFEDGTGLYETICEHRLEGDAKRERDLYRGR